MVKNKKTKLGVIFGGPSAEHEVSLASSKNVLSAIDTSKYDLYEIGVTKEGIWVLGKEAHQYLVSLADSAMLPVGMEDYYSESLDKSYSVSISDNRLPNDDQDLILEQLEVVFPVLHGDFGEDGTVQGFFRMLGIPVVGCGVLASAVAMDKIMTNQVLDSADIPQAKWFGLTTKLNNNAVEKQIIEELGGFPVFVKPANAGSSIGISKVKKKEELPKALDEAFRFDQRVIIEEGIVGRELEIAVLGNDVIEVSPVVSEICPKREFYDYEAKYLDGVTDIFLPAKIPDGILKEIQDYAIMAFRAVAGAGFARIDFFYNEDLNQVYLNEINTIPGFTTISQYPALMKHAGYSYEELVEELINLALERS